MTPQLIVQDMLKAGITRKQIAKRAKITVPSVGNILNGKVTAVHSQTWFGLLAAHAAAIRAAQRKLEALQEEYHMAVVDLDNLEWDVQQRATEPETP